MLLVYTIPISIDAYLLGGGIVSRTSKIEWISLGLPKAMYKRIEKVIVFLGVPSVPEYVRQVCARELSKDELLKEINENDEG